MPALLIRTSRESTRSAAAWICAALVTSRAIGVTRAAGWARDRRVPAYTRFAPLLRASATRACPMPRLAPVTRIVLPAIVIAVAPVWWWVPAARLAAIDTDQPHSTKSPRDRLWFAAGPGRPGECLVQAPSYRAGRPNEANRPGS